MEMGGTTMSDHTVYAATVKQVADLQSLIIAITQQRADLQAELTELRTLYVHRVRDLAFEYARANAAEAENERLRAALEAVECDVYGQCVWCFEHVNARPHKPDCARQIALGINAPDTTRPTA